MTEQRGKTHHRERIGEALKEEIGALLEGELGDPRVGLCYVNEILLAPDGKSARVFIHVEGDEAEAQETLAALTNAKGFIKRELLIRLGKRHIPELYFMVDRSVKLGGRIDELLGRIKKRTKKNT